MLEATEREKDFVKTMHVVLIHNHPSLLDECCDLINMEWPRSKTARMRTLKMSCDTLPTCLALVAESKVLGHSKVSAIGSMPGACFVESVVIHPDYRGKGLGRLIMSETEKYAASQGINTAYLSTIDQQDFYKKLGYSECAPVSIYGCLGLYSNEKTETCVGNIKKEPFTMERIPLSRTISDCSVFPSTIPPPPPLPSPIRRPEVVWLEEGYGKFCKAFMENNSKQNCNDLQDYSLHETSGKETVTYITLTRVGTWGVMFGWLLGAMLLMVRCCFLADFTVMKITVVGATPIEEEAPKASPESTNLSPEENPSATLNVPPIL
ncbi:N-acetyltransferase 6 [Gryllus bimaculatus]|nr:N-acetyltransferase 6 [Gryllus bimaculatus]